MAEYYDLYDLKHRATGRIHERGVPIPEGCCAMVVSYWVRDAAGRLLLQQRSPSKYWFPNYWECGGGAVLAGETGYEAACRELAEETGLTPPESAWRFLGEMDNAESLYDEKLGKEIFFHHWNVTYMATLEEEMPTVKKQEEEVADLRWFTPEELEEFIAQSKATRYTGEMLWSAYKDQLTAPIPKSKKKK